jgi:nucleoside-diphosphate-sugar epimerase
VSLGRLFEDVEVVYHLAGQPGVRESFGPNLAKYLRNNVQATARLIDEAARHPLHRFVYASSSSVYGQAAVSPTPESAPRRPLAPYGATKVITEELAGTAFRRQGLQAVGMRYFSAYGPGQRPDLVVARLIAAALEGRPVTINGDGSQSRDFTFVGDVVSATIAAGEVGMPGSIYNIGGGEPSSVMGLIRLVEEITGSPVALRHGPPARGDARATSADCTKAHRDLGFLPGTALEDGVAAQVTAALARPGRKSSVAAIAA